MINGWIVLAHEDVRALLQDRRVSSRVFDSGLIQRVLRAATAGEAVPLLDHPSLINIDAPDHTRLRRLSAKGFTNRYVQSLAPDIEQIVTELLDPLANQAEFDALDALARPLPAIVIAEMLGVPREERHRFEAWSAKLVRYTEVLAPEALAEAAAGDREMRAYLSALAEAKRTTPTSDLLSNLVAAEEDEEALDIDELLSLCTLLLVAGHETTTRLLGSCLHLLLQHPEQLAAVRADRSLVPAALEEALRLEPPCWQCRVWWASPSNTRVRSSRRGRCCCCRLLRRTATRHCSMRPTLSTSIGRRFRTRASVTAFICASACRLRDWRRRSR